MVAHRPRPPALQCASSTHARHPAATSGKPACGDVCRRKQRSRHPPPSQGDIRPWPHPFQAPNSSPSNCTASRPPNSSPPDDEPTLPELPTAEQAAHCFPRARRHRSRHRRDLRTLPGQAIGHSSIIGTSHVSPRCGSCCRRPGVVLVRAVSGPWRGSNGAGHATSRRTHTRRCKGYWMATGLRHPRRTSPWRNVAPTRAAPEPCCASYGRRSEIRRRR